MKFSSTTALSLVLSLTTVLAAPIKERAIEVATVYETYTEVVQETSTVWVAAPEETFYAAEASTSAQEYEKTKTWEHGYETPSASTPEVTVGTPTSSSSTTPSALSTSSSSSSSSFSSSSSSSSHTSFSSSASSSSTESTSTPTSSSIESTSSASTKATSTEPTSTTTIEPTSSKESTTQALTTSTPSISIPSTTIEIPTSTILPTLTSIAIPTTTTVTPETTIPTTTKVASTTPAPVETTTPSTGSGYSGQITYYATGLGSCGITSSDSDMIVAASHLYMGVVANPNANPHCGQKVNINGKNGVVTATIVDTCPGCSGNYDLDCSPAVFKALGCTEAEGRCDITWNLA